MTVLLQYRDIPCPYCGEAIHMQFDCSVAHQQYVEDCQVCCQPITVDVVCEGGELRAVSVADADGLGYE